MNNKRTLKTVRMVELAILTAIVLVLQLTGTAIKFPGTTGVSLVLIPIVLGAVLLGPSAGAWLGFVFGAVTYLWGGVFGMDGFTNVLFSAHPFLTALTCFGKAICAGLAAGFVYRAIYRFNPYAAAIAASAVAPIVNTGLFILGGLTMSGTLAENYASGAGVSVMYFLIIVCAGLNFIFEFLLNLVLSPVIYRVSVIVKKSVHKNLSNV